MNNTYNNYEKLILVISFLNSYKENMQANSIINFFRNVNYFTKYVLQMVVISSTAKRTIISIERRVLKRFDFYY